MDSDLCLQLRAALLRHQIPLEPVQAQISSQQHHSIFDRSRLDYLTRILEENDEELLLQLPQQQQTSYQVLLRELTECLSPNSCASSSLSMDTASPPHFPSRTSTVSFHSLLMDCARAVAANNSTDVHELVREIRTLASPQSRPVEKAALYFTNALVARLAGCGARMYAAMRQDVTRIQSISIRMNLPSLRATERFANQMILDACRGAKRVHIVDYGILYGDQWPSLIKALSERAEGPPLFKITGIDFPSLVNLEKTGNRLVDYAESCGMHLEFHSIATAAWESAQPRYHLFSELLFVNCQLRMRHIREDGIIDSPRKLFFEKILSFKPVMFFQSVVHADIGSPFFIHRFDGAWRSFLARLESFEETMKLELIDQSQLDFMDKFIEKCAMGAIACDGQNRVERISSYKTWDRLARKGQFGQLPVSKRALEMVMSVWSGHENFTYGMDENWLLLGWKDVVLNALSVWEPIEKLPRFKHQ
ncbi:scarecrow-like protein 31 [Selaginella moellendorffii]|nr:scarecrow-like protein 31 [Selaginella moellendorffii]|eukprot:XP_002977081.2 scarecrow-like protein 31 [Selaginella moellendorffii]